MKIISKIAKVALGLVFIGSSVFAQSLADAKKAIDAEQYQKAKGMLKNLTVTQPTNDENWFYLGWVYVVQDYPDSAKATFTKGINANAKSALNYVGLGVVALENKDEAGAMASFGQAFPLTGKKDSKPWLYIGKGYLLGAHDGKFPPAKANAAIDALNKGKVANPKDAELLVELGNAYRSQLKSNEAYDAYSAALALDPKSPAANVAEGVLWRYADNFEDSEKQFQAAIAIDPNYGPAYREWGETDLTWSSSLAHSDGPKASAKVKEAVENYKKYLSLTDESLESLLRYADFLVNLGDYTTIQEVATRLAKSASINPRVYRYIGYAAYENKDYANGLDAMNNWFAKAGPNRIIARDYLYLGHLQIASGKDTVQGVANLRKAAEMDTTKAEAIYKEIASMYFAKGKYTEAAAAYEEVIDKVHGKPLLFEHFYEGYSDYFAFGQQVAKAKTNPAIKPDSSLLVKADTLIGYYEQKVPSPAYQAAATRAYIADYRDTAYNNLRGLAKPHYEMVIKLLGAKTPLTAGEKRALANAYAYLGNYYQYHDKDDAKALENFTKARDLNPDNGYAKFYFEQKAAPPPQQPPAKKAQK